MTSHRFPVVATPVLATVARSGLGMITVTDAAITKKYESLAGVITVDGYDLQAYLGAVVGPVYSAGGAQIQPYARGFIVVHGGQALVVYGDIAAAWIRLGGPTGLLGLPTADTAPAPGDGALGTFTGGVIAWTAATGAYELHGAILARWQQLGGPAFGYPTSDESPVVVGGAEIGRMNSFPGGAGIYWTPAGGAWELTGAIATTWRADGGPSGNLGLPTSGVLATPGADGGTYAEFQGGVMVSHPDGPYAGTIPITSLTLQLTRFHSSFDDIHVEGFVDVSDPAQSWHDWIPNESDYASDPQPADATPVHIPVVRAATSISVSFEGLGQHSLGEDERLGYVKHTYDLSNLWGAVGDDPQHPATDGINPDFDFGAEYLFSSPQPIEPGRPFRENFMWPFRNFTTPELDQNDYAETFSEISYDESTAGHPFDDYFYSHVYQHGAYNGNCYGMVLGALYSYAGRSEFGEPIYDNPTFEYSDNLRSGGSPNQNDASDERFAHSVNIFHGYQFGQPADYWFTDVELLGLLQDPKRVFDLSQAAHEAGETQLLVIGVNKGTDQAEGHAVLPHQWEWKGGGGRIYVANPNQPWSTGHDDAAPGNFIEITTGDNNTSFWLITMGDTYWEGGSGVAGSQIYHVPFRVVGTRPARHSLNVVDAISNSASVVVGAGTDVSVSESGAAPVLTATRPGFGGVPGLVELDLVSSGPVGRHRIPARPVQVPIAVDPGREGLVPRPGRRFRLHRPPGLPGRTSTVPTRGPVPVRRAALLPSSDPTLVWTLTPPTGATATSIGVSSGRGAVIVDCDGAGASDVVTTSQMLQTAPSVALSTAAGIARTARVTITGRTGPAALVITVDGLALGADPHTVQLLEDGTGVAIHNGAGADITCSVRIARGGDVLERTGVHLAPGAVTVLAPVDPSSALAGQRLALHRLAADGSVLQTEQL